MKAESIKNSIYQNPAGYYSSIKNTVTRPAFKGAEQIAKFKQAQFQRFFGVNSNFAKLADPEILKNMTIFRRNTPWELDRFKSQIIRDMFDYGVRDFFSTIEGKKPAAYIKTSKNMQFLDKVRYPQEVDLLYIRPEHDELLAKTYPIFVLNKNEVKKIIEKNKELYTKRLNLTTDFSVERIYEVLKTDLKVSLQGKDDLIGITLGYPIQSSLIYNLEKASKTDKQLRKDIPAYKRKLLYFCESKKNPYQNMSENFKQDLIKSIKSIKKIEPFTNGMYSFIEFVNEPAEIKRINNASDDYIKNFQLDLMA